MEDLHKPGGKTEAGRTLEIVSGHTRDWKAKNLHRRSWPRVPVEIVPQRLTLRNSETASRPAKSGELLKRNVAQDERHINLSQPATAVYEPAVGGLSPGHLERQTIGL